jgi:hypothetical protein
MDSRGISGFFLIGTSRRVSVNPASYLVPQFLCVSCHLPALLCAAAGSPGFHQTNLVKPLRSQTYIIRYPTNFAHPLYSVV